MLNNILRNKNINCNISIQKDDNAYYLMTYSLINILKKYNILIFAFLFLLNKVKKIKNDALLTSFCD